MSTSLSRQLAQLRRSDAAQAAQAPTSASGPLILSLEEESLESSKLEILTKKAWNKLTSEYPDLKGFSAKVFKEHEDSDEDEEGLLPWQEDILILLSPSLLTSAGQTVLQWLMTTHQVHARHPQCLLWSCLPHYQYQIFYRVVEALQENPEGEQKFPGWLRAFRASCHPATQIGIRKHLAGDSGFFKMLCEWMVKTGRHLAARPDHNYEGLMFFFCSSVLEALANCSGVTDQQLHAVMQVIVSGIKSPDKEFFALSSTLLARVFPHVNLKEKVANKLLKVLEKTSKKVRDVSMLTLVVILYKSQRETIDKSRVIKVLSKYDQVLQEIFEDPTDISFIQKILYNLALLSEHLTTHEDAEEVLKLLEAIERGLEAKNTNQETAKVLIAHVSRALGVFKTRKKDDMNKKEMLKKLASASKRILAKLKYSFPAEYVSLSSVRTEDIDIMFMSGQDAPTPEEVAAKRAMLDSALVNAQEIFSVSKKIREKDIKSMIRENENNVVLIFKGVSPAFVLSQLDPVQVTRLVCNVLGLFEGPRSRTGAAAAAAAEFACGEAFANNEGVREELIAAKIDLELMLLPFLVGASSGACARAIRDSWFVCNRSKYLKFVFDSVEAKDRDFREDATLYLDALHQVVDQKDILEMATKIANSSRHQDPGLVAIITVLILEQLDSTKKPQKSSDNDLIEALLGLMDTIRVHFEPPEANSNPEAKDELVRLVFKARKDRAVPLELIHKVLKTVKESKLNEKLLMKLLRIACSWKKNASNRIGKDLKTLYDEALDCGEAVDYSVKIFAALDGTDLVTNSMRLHAGKRLLRLVETNNEIAKKISCVKSLNLASILSILGDNRSTTKLKRHVFLVLQASFSKNNNLFSPLAEHLCRRESDILSATSNIASVFNDFSDCQGSLKTLLALITAGKGLENAKIFTRLVFLFLNKELGAVAAYGTRALSVGDPESSGAVLDVILKYFAKDFVLNISTVKCFEFMSKVLKSDRILNTSSNQTMKAAVLALRSLRGLESLGSFTFKLFSLLCDVSSGSDDADVAMGCRDVIVQSLSLEADDFTDMLDLIWGCSAFERQQIQNSTRTRKVSTTEDLKTAYPKWNRTTFVLEMFMAAEIKSKKHKKLIKYFFGLLRLVDLVQSVDVDEINEVNTSYITDLILSCVLRTLDTCPEASGDRDLNPEALVQCLSSQSANPGAQSLALTALARAAASNADYVIQNSIPIFTFMGGHFLRRDSVHSFAVACQAIDVIVPTIRDSCKNDKEKLRKTNLGIVSTFADASLDMPVHRFAEFLRRLILLLGEREYLWIMTLMLLQKKAKNRKNVLLEQILELYSSFSSLAQLESLLQMLVNLKQDSPAIRKLLSIRTEEVGTKTTEEKPSEEFDMLRLKTFHFTTSLLSSTTLSARIREGLSRGEALGRQLELLIEVSILTIEAISKDNRKSRMHHHLLHHSEKVLESSLGILPPKAFLKITNGLLKSDHEAVRRKALEVFNAKVTEDEALRQEDEALTQILPSVGALATSNEGSESEANQQLALLALRSFARVLGSKHPGELKDALKGIAAKKFLRGLTSTNLQASAMLCVSEAFHALGPHAVSLLAPFANWLLDLLLQAQDKDDQLLKTQVLLSSVILAIQKLMEDFSGFLNPYYAKFIVGACRLKGLCEASSGLPHQRLRHLQTSLARGIPASAFISNCNASCFQELASSTSMVGALMELLAENVASLDKTGARAISADFIDFFAHKVFRFREEKDLPENELDYVEARAVMAFLALALKLSLDDFKPAFYKIFNLFLGAESMTSGSTVARVKASTGFHVSREVAKRLRGLFGFVCESLVLKATEVLVQYSENDFKAFRDEPEERVLHMLVYLLECLSSIFEHNRVESLLPKSYEDHVNSLMTYFEIPDFQCRERLFTKLSDCLDELGKSTEDDSQWKYLNYQVLLGLRSPDVEVRHCVLALVERLVEVKGDAYLSFLPDAVPFLCEILEDEDDKLEKKCRRFIARMEEIFGQSVESYFE